jgi:putative pyruvate formate lyase activating enzyme
MFEPAYLKLLKTGELAERARVAYQHLKHCDLCAHHCGINRRAMTKGAVCRTGERAAVSSYNLHFGEESPLVGHGGSGTIFFAWCNLQREYCQNYEISQLGEGQEVEPEEFAHVGF